MIEWLQEWYISHCDGEWEHENGISIGTLDNPGWSLTIYLRDTKLESMVIPYILKEKSEDDWIGYSVDKGLFKAAGGPRNLNEMIEVFKNLFQQASNQSA